MTPSHPSPRPARPDLHRLCRFFPPRYGKPSRADCAPFGLKMSCAISSSRGQGRHFAPDRAGKIPPFARELSRRGGRMSENSLWPDLPLPAWSDTCETLHRWTQIVGKVRLALTPLVNHWWNVTLYVNARGLVAPANPYAGGTFDVVFDFVDHQLRVAAGDGRTESFALAPMSVADFYAEFMRRLRRLDIDVRIWTMPNEIENAAPFDQDRTHAQYDRDYAARFRQALVQSA